MQQRQQVQLLPGSSVQPCWCVGNVQAVGVAGQKRSVGEASTTRSLTIFGSATCPSHCCPAWYQSLTSACVPGGPLLRHRQPWRAAAFNEIHSSTPVHACKACVDHDLIPSGLPTAMLTRTWPPPRPANELAGAAVVVAHAADASAQRA